MTTNPYDFGGGPQHDGQRVGEEDVWFAVVVLLFPVFVCEMQKYLRCLTYIFTYCLPGCSEGQSY